MLLISWAYRRERFHLLGCKMLPTIKEMNQNLKRPIHQLTIACLLAVSQPAHSLEEYWSSLQTRSHFNQGKNLLNFEYMERFNNGYWQDRFLTIFRLAVGGSLSDGLSYQLAVGSFNFSRQLNEKRLQQFLNYYWPANKWLDVFLRSGVEQRRFDQDPRLYFRTRQRATINFLPKLIIAPSFYNETFIVPRGGQRFWSGINENRLGSGLRITHRDIEIYLYKVSTEFRSLESKRHISAVQLFLLLNFF